MYAELSLLIKGIGASAVLTPTSPSMGTRAILYVFCVHPNWRAESGSAVALSLVIIDDWYRLLVSIVLLRDVLCEWIHDSLLNGPFVGLFRLIPHQIALDAPRQLDNLIGWILISQGEHQTRKGDEEDNRELHHCEHYKGVRCRADQDLQIRKNEGRLS